MRRLVILFALAIAAPVAVSAQQTWMVVLRTATPYPLPNPVDGIVTLTLKSGASVRLRAEDIDYVKTAQYKDRAIVQANAVTQTADAKTGGQVWVLTCGAHFAVSASVNDIDVTLSESLTSNARLGAPAPPPPAPPPPMIAYLIDSRTVIRKTPSDTAPALATVGPLDVVQIESAKPGWVQVNVARENEPAVDGWIRGKGDNIIRRRDWFAARVKLVEVKSEHPDWSLAIDADVIRGNVHVGFTPEQVRAALGDPRSETTQETSAGTTLRWVYSDQVVDFKAGRVATVTKVQ